MLKFVPIALLAFACSTPPADGEPAGEPPPHADTATWSYETLSPAERAVVDRSRDVAAWHGVHRHFADAVREAARRAQSLAGSER